MQQGSWAGAGQRIGTGHLRSTCGAGEWCGSRWPCGLAGMLQTGFHERLVHGGSNWTAWPVHHYPASLPTRVQSHAVRSSGRRQELIALSAATSIPNSKPGPGWVQEGLGSSPRCSC